MKIQMITDHWSLCVLHRGFYRGYELPADLEQHEEQIYRWEEKSRIRLNKTMINLDCQDVIPLLAFLNWIFLSYDLTSINKTFKWNDHKRYSYSPDSNSQKPNSITVKSATIPSFSYPFTQNAQTMRHSDSHLVTGSKREFIHIIRLNVSIENNFGDVKKSKCSLRDSIAMY